MTPLEAVAVVFFAALITDLATGIGTLPFFFVDEFSKKWLIGMWGLASGIMLSASFLGLIPEGLAAARNYPLFSSRYLAVGIGLVLGAAVVTVAKRLVDEAEIDPGTFKEGDFREMVLILGVLTVHSFPEGVAVGVSFAEMGLHAASSLAAIPAIAITMTVAISIHNIPEGVAISIPFKASGVSNWRTMGAAIFSSLPQPIGAVLAYIFVTQARMVLPAGYGFAAGAMIYLVLTEFVKDAFEEAENLETSGWPEFAAGNVAGLAVMTALFLVL